MDRGEVRRVTLGVRDLALARRLYSGLLGMTVVGEWTFSRDDVRDEGDVARFARGLGLEQPEALAILDLEPPGTTVGSLRLVRVGDGAAPRINEDARAYDHGHPANRRPNYLFGEWDPHLIDRHGHYRRYQGYANRGWANRPGHVDRQFPIVAHDGSVVRVAGWPAEAEVAC